MFIQDFFIRLHRLTAGYHPIKDNFVNLGLLLIRVYAGLTIMTAGLNKLPLTDWMVDQVVSMGFPFPVFFGWVASFSEFAFGFLLVFGLVTRLSGVMLACTMGVAAFGFQKVLPLVDMHIAQLYFWVFLTFAFTGAGRYSLDNWIVQQLDKGRISRSYLGTICLAALLSIGLFIEFSAPDAVVEEESDLVIDSINVPGTFNQWNPAANSMIKTDEDTYELDLVFEKAGPIAFKFTANMSWENNLGDQDQTHKGFPIEGTADRDVQEDNGNIEAYIPASGSYRLRFNLKTYVYNLDSIRIE